MFTNVLVSELAISEEPLTEPFVVVMTFSDIVVVIGGGDDDCGGVSVVVVLSVVVGVWI